MSGRRRCSACTTLRSHHPGENECSGCGRTLATKNGYCRLCWHQADLESKAAGGLPRGPITVLETGVRLRHHQLFFDQMQYRSPQTPIHPHGRRRGRPPKPPPSPAGRPAIRWSQQRLFEARRDYSRFDAGRDYDLTNPWLTWATYLAYRRGEAHGWTRRVHLATRRGLAIMLSPHLAGDVIRYSDLLPAMRARNIGAERVAGILQEMGILADDREPAFEGWLGSKLAALTPGISRDVEAWLRALHDGSPRNRARHRSTVYSHMSNTRTALLTWSDCYDHLREVTRDDVLALLEDLHGSQRRNTLSSLRSLFAFGKKNGTIFRNPASHLRPGQRSSGVIQPLAPEDLGLAVTSASTHASRLALALAAVHAARLKAIQELLIDDIDLGNRRLIIAGRSRPLDDLTRKLILDWLDHRRTRWPSTANPHLIINQQTAMETRPVSQKCG